MIFELRMGSEEKADTESWDKRIPGTRRKGSPSGPLELGEQRRGAEERRPGVSRGQSAWGSVVSLRVWAGLVSVGV